MSQYKYWLLPLPASEVILKLCTAAASLSKGHEVDLTVQTNIGSFSVPRSATPKLEAEAKALIDTLSSCPQCELDWATLKFPSTNGEFSYRCDGLTARFEIGNQADPVKPHDVYKALSKQFTLQRRAAVAPERLSADQKEAFEFVQATQLAFSAEAARLSHLSAQEAARFIETTREATVRLEAEYQQRKKKLDEDIAAERKTLEQERQSHADYVKGYELRENTAIRRKLLDDILAKHENQKEFAFSKHTENTRLGVVAAMVLLIVGSISLAVFFGWRISGEDANTDWHTYLGLAVCFGVFVTSLIYLAKWNDRYFRDHADAEIANRKFANDIMRASWIAELYIELRKNRGPELPVEMLRSFTNQLFNPTFSPEDLKHPYEQVTDTLKGITKIKANKDGVELQSAKAK